ncbi:potassium channel family protein [Candidatus Poribacteria bacterium]
MTENLEPFTRHGTEEEPIQVSADEILNAIAEGRDVDVEYAVVEGSLDIGDISERLTTGKSSKLLIRGRTVIRSCEVKGEVKLGYEHYPGRVVFCRDTIFREVTFADKVSFAGALFNQSASFCKTSFEKGASFSNSSFVAGVNFYETKATREDKINLDGTVFEGYKISSMHISHFSAGTFHSAGVEHRKSGEIPGSKFFEYAGRYYSLDREYIKASDSFRNAKVEYGKEGKYREVRRAYVKEMGSIRKSLKAPEGSNIAKHIWFLLKRSGYGVWKSTCNYGESPLLLAIWIVGIICIFALIYSPYIDWWPPSSWESWASIGFGENPYSEGNALLTALYFSVVTFATLGFGDITPLSSAGKICVIIEVLLGYVMFGMLISLVARKMTRS